MGRESRDNYEELDSTLDPHRIEERRTVAAEVSSRLRDRGVWLTGRETSDDLADLLTAVEEFEAAVEAHGGDLMMDDLKSSRPDDPHFVVPRRGHGEAIRAYIGRIDEAAARLWHHPRGPSLA